MPLESQTRQVERELPSPSAVVQRVLTLLNDDSVTMGALAAALGADPALTGRVLRLANSAAFNDAGGTVLVLGEALQRLGVVAVRQVLVSFSLVDRYRQGHCEGFDYAGFWSQSLATAVCARQLARLAQIPHPADCFTLGLLTRVGELGLATMYPQEYGALHQDLAGASAERIIASERERLATDRFSLAARLMRMWALPDSLAVAVEVAGDPASIGPGAAAATLKLARVLQVCVQIGLLFGQQRPAEGAPEWPVALRRLCNGLGFTEDVMATNLPLIEAEWREWGHTLGLPLLGQAPVLTDVREEAEVIPFPGVDVGQPRPQLSDHEASAALEHRSEAWANAARRISPRHAPIDWNIPSTADGKLAGHGPDRDAGARPIVPSAESSTDGSQPPVIERTVGAEDTPAANPTAADKVHAGAQPASTAPHASAPDQGMRILLAHPEPARTAAWTALMASQGHIVRTVDSGEQALAQLLSAPPEVVLCDLDLQRMDALTLFRSVRSSRPGKQIYLIALAPRDRPGALEAAFGAGADDFIGYPVQASEMLARLRAAERFIDMQQRLLDDQEQVRQLVNELAKANARLEQDAETDPLTGIANRRRATDQLLRAVRLAEEENQPLGVFLIDLDHFKRVNDTWGHATGDEVLRQAAQTLQAYLRTSDLVARFGGEEFLVIAPGTSAQNAAALAERLRAGISRLRISIGREQISVTFSVGVSVYDPTTSPRKRTPEALLHMADEALYRAKDSGRNRVCVAADRPGSGRAPELPG